MDVYLTAKRSRAGVVVVQVCRMEFRGPWAWVRRLTEWIVRLLTVRGIMTNVALAPRATMRWEAHSDTPIVFGSDRCATLGAITYGAN